MNGKRGKQNSKKPRTPPARNGVPAAANRRAARNAAPGDTAAIAAANAAASRSGSHTGTAVAATVYKPTPAEIARGLYTPDGKPVVSPQAQTIAQNASAARAAREHKAYGGAAQVKGKRPASPQAAGKRPAPSKKQRGKVPESRRRAKSQGKNNGRSVRPQPAKLSAQTAAERRRQIVERQNFTEEQLEFLRRRSGIKRYYIKKRRISAITLFFTRFITLVIVYVTLFAVSSGLFWLSLYHFDRDKGEDVVYQLGENDTDENYKVATLDYRDRMRGGQLYIDFTELAGYLEFITTGDTGELRFLTKYEGGEEVIFAVGTSSVTINGSMTRMPVPSYYEDGVLYVPLDFIQTYINGISVGTGEEDGRLIVYRKYTLNADDEKVYEDISFTVKPQTPSEHIDENSLPIEIKIATEPNHTGDEATGQTDDQAG